MHDCRISNLNTLYQIISSRLCILTNLSVGSRQQGPRWSTVETAGAFRHSLVLQETVDQAQTWYRAHCQIAENATTGSCLPEIVHLTYTVTYRQSSPSAALTACCRDEYVISVFTDHIHYSSPYFIDACRLGALA